MHSRLLTRAAASVAALVLFVACALQQRVDADPVPCGGVPVPISTSASGSTQIATSVSSFRMFICGFDIIAGGTTAVTINTGTGTACATGTVALSGAYPLTTQTGLAVQRTYYAIVAPGVNVCINNSNAISVQGSMSVGYAP
jgi:hypothetical protein